MTVKQLLGVQALVAAVLGCGGAVALVHWGDLTDRTSVAGDYLLLVGPLIGVVFAGFALVVGLLSDRYILWLSQQPSGMRAFLAPFVVSIGVQVLALLTTVLYRAAAPHLSRDWEQALFVATSFLFVYSLFDVVALAKNILAHGVTRADSVVLDALESRMGRHGEN